MSLRFIPAGVATDTIVGAIAGPRVAHSRPGPRYSHRNPMILWSLLTDAPTAASPDAVTAADDPRSH